MLEISVIGTVAEVNTTVDAVVSTVVGTILGIESSGILFTQS